jgi:hypothetical protein
MVNSMRRHIPEDESEFYHNVQLHERFWGDKHYHGRPSIKEIMSAEVMVVWLSKEKEAKPYITLHDSLADMERYFARLLFRSEIAQVRRCVWRIFSKRRRVFVRAVKVIFDEVENFS